MKKITWFILTLIVLGSSLLARVIAMQLSPTTLEVVGRLVWSG